LFRAHGRFVESLGGRYITAEDVGTSPQDMEFVKRETRHVAGLLNLSGDPSPVTGYGVYVGMKAAAKAKWGNDSLAGRTVAVQGAGKVAYYLMSHLHDEGAKLIVCDIDDAKVKRCVDEFGATAVAPDAIFDAKADVFAPCALGGIVNDDTLTRLKVGVIAGGANNQLGEARHGRELEKLGMLYAPDYVINGGGVINVYGELQGWTMDRAKRKAQEIYDTILRVFSIASRDGVPSFEAADRLAEERIRSVAALKDMWVAGDR
jgi:leucine dehydrogenase